MPIMQPFPIMKSLGKEYFGRFRLHYGHFHYFSRRNSLDLQPTWITISPCEWIEFEFVNQEFTVYGPKATSPDTIHCLPDHRYLSQLYLQNLAPLWLRVDPILPAQGSGRDLTHSQVSWFLVKSQERAHSILIPLSSPFIRALMSLLSQIFPSSLYSACSSQLHSPALSNPQLEGSNGP